MSNGDHRYLLFMPYCTLESIRNCCTFLYATIEQPFAIVLRANPVRTVANRIKHEMKWVEK